MTAQGTESIKSFNCPKCGASLPAQIMEHFIICQYCGSSLIWQPGTEKSKEEQPVVTRGMRMKQFACTDTQGTGLEIFRMLVPVGWQANGGCRWLLDNPSMPAAVDFQIFNPHGAEMFAIFPNLNFVWNENPMARMFNPVGSKYFGAEVRQPVNIRDAFHNLILPRYRGSVQSLQVLNEQPVPELPQIARCEAPLTGGSAEGGKIRIRYSLQGQQYDEELYGIVEIYPLPGGLSLWYTNFLFSFRAGAGLLDATADLFKVMIFSFKPNPQWLAAVKSIAQWLAQQQIQRIHHIGQIGEIYARTGREMREQNLNDWYAKQAVYDRLSTDWSRTIRGVDAFYDPHREEVVELPGGYGQAWANNLGEYIVTDSLDYNPNLGSNLNWQPMTPQ